MDPVEKFIILLSVPLIYRLAVFLFIFVSIRQGMPGLANTNGIVPQMASGKDCRHLVTFFRGSFGIPVDSACYYLLVKKRGR